MRLPWVSREQYDSVLAAKDQLIAALSSQNEALAARLAAPVAVSVSLPEGFAVQMPAVVGRRTKRPRDPEAPRSAPLRETDWASVDPNDNEAIARIAAKELGGPVPAHVLSRTVSQIKLNIRTARAQKLRETLQSGKVGTQARPETEEEAMAQGSAYVPEEIRRLIESAERG